MRTILITLCAALASATAYASELRWGAFAIAHEKICTPMAGSSRCVLHERMGGGISIGHASQARAEEAALIQCSVSGITGCAIVKTFNDCAFITHGMNTQKREMQFFIAKTAQYAAAACTLAGMESCVEPKGGCN